MTRLRTTDDLVGWLAGHPEKVGLVVRRGLPGDDASGTDSRTGTNAEATSGATTVAPAAADADGVGELRHNADALFPLAATRIVVILGAYAEAVAQRRLDPDELVPLPEIQRWWVRGTDGGAHLGAERDWRRRERITRGQVLAVPLAEVAHGMVRWSSNACADYLLARLGPETVTGWAARRGMPQQQPLYPMHDELAGWIQYGDAWARLSPAEREDALGAGASGGPSPRSANRWRMARLGAERQARLAAVSCSGTPAEYAGLMARLHSDASGMAREEAQVMRHALGWPREVSERNAQRFTVFASKGGSLAGVLTEVSYLVSTDGVSLVVAQFYRDLPLAVWKPAARSLVHQRLALELATGTRGLSTLRAVLSADADADPV